MTLQFQSIKLASDSKDYFDLKIALTGMPGDKQAMHWVIAQRGDNGCVVTLLATVNAQDVIGPSYYIDLTKHRVYPDNQQAAQVFILMPEVSAGPGVPFP